MFTQQSFNNRKSQLISNQPIGHRAQKRRRAAHTQVSLKHLNREKPHYKINDNLQTTVNILQKALFGKGETFSSTAFLHIKKYRQTLTRTHDAILQQVHNQVYTLPPTHAYIHPTQFQNSCKHET